MDKLFTLLDIQRHAHEAQTREGFIHVAVNRTYDIVPYDQALFLDCNGLAIRLERISGNAIPDDDSPAAQAVKAVVSGVIRQAFHKDRVISLSELDSRKTGCLILLQTTGEGVMGALWIESSRPYNDAELRILDELAVTYSQILALWNFRNTPSVSGFFLGSARKKKLLVAAILLVSLFPVRLGVTAPAEIVARKAELVTAPFDGVLDKVNVRPGDVVRAGDILASLERQTLQTRKDVAQQELEVSRSAYSRIQRQSLDRPDKKTAMIELQSDIKAKEIAYDYAKYLYDRSEIKAGRDGVAVFSDQSSLIGKAVTTGTKIMMIADPDDYELMVRVPVNAMISTSGNEKVRFFMNVASFRSYRAVITNIGYQASPDPDGLLTYKVMADVVGRNTHMKIGWKGSASIKGGWTVLSYAILRRPVIALRNIIGA